MGDGNPEDWVTTIDRLAELDFDTLIMGHGRPAGRDWLRHASLLPPDIGEGSVVSRMPDSNRMIVNFVPAEPVPILSGYPSITLTMAVDGSVIEAQIRWANIVRSDVYQLMSADQAWQLVSTGQAYLDPDLSQAGIDPGTDVKGRVTFTAISVAYATAGPPGGASTSSRSTSLKGGSGRRVTKRRTRSRPTSRRSRTQGRRSDKSLLYREWGE